jgi:hypothetical protein
MFLKSDIKMASCDIPTVIEITAAFVFKAIILTSEILGRSDLALQ